MLSIGSLQLETPLFLAPIAGYCDLAFRMVCRSFNAHPDGVGAGLGLACTDLLSPQGLLRGTAKSMDLAKTNEFDRPVGMQLYGSNPQIMADGAKWAVDHGASVVDINMGCPVDKVTKKDGGSKLLCSPDGAVRLVESVRHAVDQASGGQVPLTVKVRLGWFTDQPVASMLAPRFIESGAQAITVHGRSTEQRFKGTVNLEGIKDVVDAVAGRVPVIGNGDVKTPQDAERMLKDTGCDGVMIGRGALGTPWIFRDVWAYLQTGVIPPPLSLQERTEVILRYFDLLIEHRGERHAMMQIRQRISQLGKRMGDNSKPIRNRVRLAQTPESIREHITAFAASPPDGADGVAGAEVANQATT